MKTRCLALAIVLSSLFMGPPSMAVTRQTVTVGSKAFTESYVLAEIAAQLLQDSTSIEVKRRFGLGGTGIVFQAIQSGEIDVYPEYTGTISETILQNPKAQSIEEIRAKLESMGLTMSEPLGFDNTYAIAVRREIAEKFGLSSISDLEKASELRAAFSHEFMNRPDGWPGLRRKYGIDLKKTRAVAHSLAYEALARGESDLMDVYSTDAKIQKLDLVVLKDDLEYFPKYLAVWVARKSFVDRFPKLWQVLREQEGSLNQQAMLELNARADLQGESFARIASSFLKRDSARYDVALWRRIWTRTKQHIGLVGISLFASILFGLPFGVIAARKRKLGQLILVVSGVVQTIPSLALLCFLIPFFGIGTAPALFALFLYGLLPIVTNTLMGLTSLDPKVDESARALGMSQWQRLRWVELPLASQSILAGIKTSAIIGIGTATLAALIGAGGYGVPIVTGLALNDINTILIGAIPAAVLALVAHVGFEVLEIVCIPRGLR